MFYSLPQFSPWTAAHYSVSAQRPGPGCWQKCWRFASTRTQSVDTPTTMKIRCCCKSNRYSNGSYFKTCMTEWRDLQATTATWSMSKNQPSTSRRKTFSQHKECPPILSAPTLAPSIRKSQPKATPRTKPTEKTSSALQQSASRKGLQRGSPRSLEKT